MILQICIFTWRFDILQEWSEGHGGGPPTRDHYFLSSKFSVGNIFSTLVWASNRRRRMCRGCVPDLTCHWWVRSVADHNLFCPNRMIIIVILIMGRSRTTTYFVRALSSSPITQAMQWLPNMYQAKIPSFSSQQCPLSRSSQMTTKQNKVGQKKIQIAFWDVTWC